MRCWSRQQIAGHLRVACASALAVGSAACSMHPLTEDVSRANTYDIVEEIRCEAHAGLNQVPAGHPFLDHSAIGYDFTFTITEENDLNTPSTPAELKFDRPGHRKGSDLNWDLTASTTKTRKNTRQFRIVESLAQLKKANCPDGPKRPDWIYPIAGGIGIDELVSTYINLERVTQLASGLLPTPGDVAKGESVVFSDQLDFTTIISGGVTPTLTLQTIAGKTRLAKATITPSASRTDVHSVVVALAKDGSGVQPPGARSALARMAVSGPNGLSRQGARKVDAVAEQAAPAKSRVLFELERRRLLTEDQTLFTTFIDAVRAPN
jgi:hypothetical protein